MFDSKMMQRVDRGAIGRTMASPVGELTLIASDAGLHALLFASERLRAMGDAKGIEARGEHPILDEAERQLGEYFLQRRVAFELPLAPRGTDFQMKVWKLLLEIPYGATESYGDLAARTGDRNRARAVGLANSKNPIAIVIPCHRVIGRSGALTGFGGGLQVKETLLALEARKKIERTSLQSA